jgi:integrase
MQKVKTRLNVRLKKQAGGGLRPFWYGQFTEGRKHREINTNVRWRGTPPESGKGSDPGDADFDASRREAQAALTAYVEEAQHKGRAEHLTERLIQSKTGRAVEYVTIADLPTRWASLEREAPITKVYRKSSEAHFARFLRFMEEQNPGAVYVYEITKADAGAFLRLLRETLAPATARYARNLIAGTVARFMPVGAADPFSNTATRRGNGAPKSIHRRPFTAEELALLLNAARPDPFLFPLVATAACTGMRRGDVCRLKWESVDLAAGMIDTKAAKTGEPVEIPIFGPLQEVFVSCRRTESPFVFPEAARMYEKNSYGLTYRFKRIVASIFQPETEPPPKGRTDAAAIKAEALRKIAELPPGPRRDRIRDTFERYAAGQSVRDIDRETGRVRATISNDLHTVQDLTGKRFLPTSVKGERGRNVRAAIAKTTRIERKHGQRAASVRDWHALRTTFVTLALIAGVPVETVKRITGHKTTEIVMENYFRPDREQFKKVLFGSMPEVLTGKRQMIPGRKERLNPAEEMAAIVGKIQDGTATAKDKKRLQTLAAKA